FELDVIELRDRVIGDADDDRSFADPDHCDRRVPAHRPLGEQLDLYAAHGTAAAARCTRDAALLQHVGRGPHQTEHDAQRDHQAEEEAEGFADVHQNSSTTISETRMPNSSSTTTT